MTDATFEAAVSTITDGLMAEMMENARSGIFIRIPAGRIGIEARTTDTRSQLRARVHAAARSATYDDIRASM